MSNIRELFRLPGRPGARIAAGLGAAAVLMAGLAFGQNPAPGNPIPEPSTATMSVPAGYTVHEAVDLGGRMSNVMGSPAMYGTMVNLSSGPRVPPILRRKSLCGRVRALSSGGS